MPTSSPSAHTNSIPRRFGRALLLRCPRCGSGTLRTGWFRFRDHCPTCALDLDRNESGYQVGSYFVGIVILFVTFGVAFLSTVALTWPTPPWNAIQWGSIGWMALGPVALLPFTKTIYLALDLTLRPDGTG